MKMLIDDINEFVKSIPAARVVQNGERRIKVNELSSADSAKVYKEIVAESTLRFKEYMRNTYPHLNI